ncbi:hypothetical protein TSUD_233220 [Trifolium subterraneum]|uniref:Uncharacterized protein n=1 Tax=Trifolium subterraneum TaxID=3900 RepID=A0A2Z6M6D2_TRISU|nr:hypothetical protein TSUD_233220 [Trifolium subterraneum]
MNINYFFERRPESKQREEGRREGGGDHRIQGDKSFREAVVGKELVGVKGGEGTSANRVQEAYVAVKEVVWEVEVEEERLVSLKGGFVGYLVDDREVQSIQNNFRMGGFHNLKVTNMGHKQVLLWSDKVDEVKEVVETVGWWCSLFEKIVPWSPDLISNHRVTWLRCFGVPTHAWGMDLFRSLAFKYGKFIELDENTTQMKRCDVARVKIVTKELKPIDSVMVIKVGAGWVEEQSSRASYGVNSNCAVADGCWSESGSDAEVSESCQVLLELQARGGDRPLAEGTLRENVYSEGEMSGNIPNLLGYSEKALVNFDNDKEKCDLLEADETTQVLEGEFIMPRSSDKAVMGTPEGVGISKDYEVGYEVDFGEKGVVAPCGDKSVCSCSEDMGLVAHVKVYVTDFELGGHVSAGLAQGNGLSKKLPVIKNHKKSMKARGSAKTKSGNRRFNPLIPSNKLSNNPGKLKSLPRRKRSSTNMGGGKQQEVGGSEIEAN